MDTDSSLIGLAPSDSAMHECTEQERHLFQQVGTWRALEGSALKSEVRKTADKINELITINKGMLISVIFNSFYICIPFIFSITFNMLTPFHKYPDLLQYSR